MLRRDCLGWMARAGLAGCWPAAMPAHAQAGAQIEEPLADPVRLALRAAIEIDPRQASAVPSTKGVL